MNLKSSVGFKRGFKTNLNKIGSGIRNIFSPGQKIEKRIKRYFREFLANKELMRLTPNTLRSYESQLKALELYLVKNNIDPIKASAQEIRDFQHYLFAREPKLSRNTIKDYLRMTKLFFYWLIKQYDLKNNPLIKLEKVKSIKVLRKVIKPEELSKMLECCSGSSFQDVRNHAIIWLMWDCGLRRNEIISAKLSDLELENRTLKIMGKGNKPHIVEFDEKTKLALENWLNTKGEVECDILFTTENNTSINKDYFTRMIKKIGKKAGVSVTPHHIRRSRITYLAANGAKPFDLQSYARHESIETTMKYINLNETEKNVTAMRNQCGIGEVA